MEITESIQHEDGSVTFTCHTTKEETEFFVGYAILDILQKQVERIKDENNICPSVSE